VSKKTNKHEFDSFQDFENKFSNSPVSKKSDNRVDNRAKEICKHNEKIFDNLDVFGGNKDTKSYGTTDKTIDSGSSKVSNNQAPLIDLFGGSINTNTNIAKPNNNVFAIDNLMFSATNNGTNGITNNPHHGGQVPNMQVNNNLGGQYQGNFNNNNLYMNQGGMSGNNNTHMQSNANNFQNRNTISYFDNSTTSYSNPNTHSIPINQSNTELEIKKEEPMNDFKVSFGFNFRNKSWTIKT
jgi:hypothetical protein